MDIVIQQPSILCLDDSCLLSILCSNAFLTHLDILRVGRCCKRMHSLCQSELLWQAQYKALYGHAQQHGLTKAEIYRTAFKERFIRDASEQRMKRRLQRYRLQSDVNTVQRELKQMQGRIEHEQREQKRITQELRRLQHAKAVQSVPAQLFHLNAVKLYHNQVVQSAPISVEAELASLQQQQRVSQVELKTLQAGIKSRKQRLSTYTRQLAAMEG